MAVSFLRVRSRVLDGPRRGMDHGQRGVALTVAKRRSGLLLPKVRIEASLADGTVVAIAHSLGRSPREYQVAGPNEAIVATLLSFAPATGMLLRIAT